VRRGEVGFDAGVDAEANGVVGLADLPLHAAALHLLRNSASLSVATRDSREAENSCLLSLRGRKETSGFEPLGLIFRSLPALSEKKRKKTKAICPRDCFADRTYLFLLQSLAGTQFIVEISFIYMCIKSI
jgi:hypothetical protein